MEEELQKQVDQAAISGIIRLLKEDDVQRLLDNLNGKTLPQAVYDSFLVKQVFIQEKIVGYIKKVYGLETLTKCRELAKALHISNEDILLAVVQTIEEECHFSIPQKFETIIDVFHVPNSRLGTKKIIQAAESEIDDLRMRSDNKFLRLFSILKHVPLSDAYKEKAAYKAMRLLFFEEDTDEKLYSEILLLTGINYQRRMKLAASIMSEIEEIKDSWRYVRALYQYDIDRSLLNPLTIKAMAIDVAINYQERYGVEALVSHFNLCKEDFYGENSRKIIGQMLERGKLTELYRFVDFVEMPPEKVKEVVIDKLPLLIGKEKALVSDLAKRYNIPEEEILKAVKKRFIDSLLGMDESSPGYWVDKFKLSEEYLMSEPVLNAAKVALTNAYFRLNWTEVDDLKRMFKIE